jgi:hypothetical protein
MKTHLDVSRMGRGGKLYEHREEQFCRIIVWGMKDLIKSIFQNVQTSVNILFMAKETSLFILSAPDHPVFMDWSLLRSA